eukprot:g2743.t1
MGGIDIVVGVKVGIEKPERERPEEGRVVTNVRFAQKSSRDEYESAEHAYLLKSIVDTALGGESGDKEKNTRRFLSIVPGKFCWVLYVDVVVFGPTQRMTPDATVLATLAALKDTRRPRLEISKAGDNVSVDSGAEYQSLPRHFLEALPVCVTLARLGDSFVVDATRNELACSDMHITVAVNGRGDVCGVDKKCHGSIASEALLAALQIGQAVSLRLLKKVRAVVVGDSAAGKDAVCQGLLA